MEKLSEVIKKKREMNNFSIEKVSEETRIPRKFIEMIEEERWEEFPSKVHLKGYLKIYCDYLKIDGMNFDDFIKRIFPQEKKEDEMEEVEDKNKIFWALFLPFLFLLIFVITLLLLP